MCLPLEALHCIKSECAGQHAQPDDGAGRSDVRAAWPEQARHQHGSARVVDNICSNKQGVNEESTAGLGASRQQEIQQMLMVSWWSVGKQRTECETGISTSSEMV